MDSCGLVGCRKDSNMIVMRKSDATTLCLLPGFADSGTLTCDSRSAIIFNSLITSAFIVAGDIKSLISFMGEFRKQFSVEFVTVLSTNKLDQESSSTP